MESFSTPVALSSVQTVVNALDGAMNMNGIHGSSQKQKLLGFDTKITFFMQGIRIRLIETQVMSKPLEM